MRDQMIKVLGVYEKYVNAYSEFIIMGRNRVQKGLSEKNEMVNALLEHWEEADDEFTIEKARLPESERQALTREYNTIKSNLEQRIRVL